ncbi:MAG: hypothetical protein ACUVV6_01610 [Thermoplasmatota archaeon]
MGRGAADWMRDAGRRGVELGAEVVEKGIGAAREAARKRTCPEFKPCGPESGDEDSCSAAGKRPASADAATYPQKVLKPRPAPPGPGGRTRRQG